MSMEESLIEAAARLFKEGANLNMQLLDPWAMSREDLHCFIEGRKKREARRVIGKPAKRPRTHFEWWMDGSTECVVLERDGGSNRVTLDIRLKWREKDDNELELLQSCNWLKMNTATIYTDGKRARLALLDSFEWWFETHWRVEMDQ